MKSVARNTVVAFRYRMLNGKGEVLEDTTSATPTRYLHGSGAIAPSLQEQMNGLFPGDRKKIFLNPLPDDAGICFDVFVDSVRPADENEIILGYPVEPVIASCDDDCECHYPI